MAQQENQGNAGQKPDWHQAVASCCVRGLGLRRMHHTVEVEDTPAVRGMINKVYYLVKCEA